VASFWLGIFALVLIGFFWLNVYIQWVTSEHFAATYIAPIQYCLFLLIGIAGLNATSFGLAALIAIKRSHRSLFGQGVAIFGFCFGIIAIVCFGILIYLLSFYS